MSRIGKLFITVPEGVAITASDSSCTVTGPKGTITFAYSPLVSISIEDAKALVKRADNSDMARAQHGLIRTLLANAIIGASEGFTKQLEIQGVGYRAAMQGADLNLSLGYSHPIIVKAPEGIAFKVEKNIISVSGIEKEKVGEISAQIRAHRKPDVYKGKGIRYVGEYVRRKAGKTAKA
jgi:large subunit ribosomal protein L6